MDEIVKPTTRVFRAKMSNRVAQKMGFAVFGLLGALEIGTVTFRLVSRQHLVASFFAFAAPFLLVFVALMFWLLKYGRTKARIEVCGNDISAFDDQGSQIAVGNMRDIARVYRSRVPYTNDYRNTPIVDYFHVLFIDGTLLTFSEHYDEHYMLLKMLHARTGTDPTPMSMSDFRMLELQKPEARALAARESKALT